MPMTMCFDEDHLSRSARTMNRQRPPALAKPTRGGGRSLLIDYSKHRVVEEELKPLDRFLVSNNSNRQSPTRRASNNDSEDVDSSMHSFAAEDDHKEDNMTTEAMSLRSLVQHGGFRRSSHHSRNPVRSIQEDHEISNSSFGVPDLAPMDNASEKSQSLLGPREDEEDDCESLQDSFAGESMSVATMSPRPSPSTSRRGAGSRRNLLAGTRKYQSMTNLGGTGSTSPASNGISFSLRRRAHKKRSSIGTVAEEAESMADRFHSSLGRIDFKAINEMLDESEGDHHQHKSEPFSVPTASRSNPSQDRRAMLVRHSSVSALQSGDRQFHLDISESPVAPRSKRSVFQRSATLSARHLPGTIEVRPQASRRQGSSRTLGRHSQRGNGATSGSLNGSSHHSSGRSRGVRANRTMPSKRSEVANAMSVSTHSYFDDGSASPRRNLASASVPSRRDMMARQLSSRRGLGTNVKAASCGSSDRNGGMDDSSYFVTGSRIRRGASCRQLLC